MTDSPYRHLCLVLQRRNRNLQVIFCGHRTGSRPHSRQFRHLVCAVVSAHEGIVSMVDMYTPSESPRSTSPQPHAPMSACLSLSCGHASCTQQLTETRVRATEHEPHSLALRPHRCRPSLLHRSLAHRMGFVDRSRRPPTHACMLRLD